MRILIFCFIALLLLSACGGEDMVLDTPEISSATLSGAQLPDLDPGRTYHYAFPDANPEALLLTLWESGIPVEVGILPLDNQCADPRGPSFTVLLTRSDSRMIGFGFQPGEGRLACATSFQTYRVQ